MPVNQELKGLLSKRSQIKAKIKRNKNFLDKCTGSQNIEELKIRLKKVEECWQEFEDIQYRIEDIDTDKDHDAERDEFEQQYFEICGEINSFITKHSNSQSEAVAILTSNSSNNTSHSSDSSIPVRLPTINLPSFSGKYDEWMPFYDTFTALIDKNNSLNDVQKLHYLKAALVSDAADVIKNVELTASNYPVALSLLKDQFQNTRLIVQQHVKSLFELSHVQRDNPISLRQLINNTLNHLRGLEALNVHVDERDPFIIHLIITKLDTSTHREWELTTQPNELPTIKELTDFLQKRCQILENISHSRINTISTFHKSSFQSQSKHVTHTFQPKTKSHISVEEINCEVCNGKHPVYQCHELLQASHEERLKKLSAAKLCLNCLRPGHRIQHCKSRGCKRCNKKHNTALHYSSSDPRLKAIQSQQPSLFSKNEESTTNAITATTNIITNSQGGEVLLSTALVDITGPSGIKVTCRAFLDNGSQSSFITESLCQRLKLKKQGSPILVTGISEGTTNVASKVQTTFQSRNSNYEALATFLVLPKITGLLPTQTIDTSKWNIPQNIKIADPTFFKSSKVDILLGQEYFLDILEDGRLKNPNMPILQNTKLGWIFGGKVDTLQTSTETFCHFTTIERLNENIQAFWKIEEPVRKTTFLTTENKLCEDLYNSSVQRQADGRYTVKMPLKQDPLKLGSSREIAIKRFQQVERRFKQNNDLHQQYKSFMKEYEELGHMEQVSEDDSINPTYYLPHHPVFKESSTTTKLRVVFDASAKTSTGGSLNDNLMIGPTLQEDLFSILVRFRIHPYILTADIEKMYRQIWIHPSQRDLLRIVWRDDNTKPLLTYRLNTVTYGTACAPYLAIKTLQRIAQDEELRFPEAAKIVMKDFYVDDVLTGTDDIKKAMMIQKQLIELLKSGGFNLRKFNSNCNQLLAGLPSNMVERNPQRLPTPDDSTIKTLGIFWDAEADEIKFKYTFTTDTQNKSAVTKRTILSDISKLFDPLGIISPIIVNAKILMQDLWKQRLDWDEALPEQFVNRWQKFNQDLISLNNINITRCVLINQKGGTFELHGFSDASERAYGAVIYMRHQLGDGTTKITLLCSKSKVAPLKTLSLPRLELCGAVLLAELMSHVKTALTDHRIDKVTYWTDSTIVLAWLSTDAACWKTFIAHRVAKIQDLSNYADWRHVRSEDNPADLVSRGMNADGIMSSHLWNSGPMWLSQDSSNWPITSTTHQKEIPERKKPIISAALIQSSESSAIDYIIDKFSTLQKLLRVTSFCLRFINNCKTPEARVTGPLTPDELNKSLKHLIKHEQKRYFSKEFKSLSASNNVHNKSKLLMLHPFKDHEDIIRVGGRLDNAAIKPDQKHPVVLAAKSRLTRLIIENEHVRNLHVGPQTLLYIIRQQYWPLNARMKSEK